MITSNLKGTDDSIKTNLRAQRMKSDGGRGYLRLNNGILQTKSGKMKTVSVMQSKGKWCMMGSERGKPFQRRGGAFCAT